MSLIISTFVRGAMIACDARLLTITIVVMTDSSVPEKKSKSELEQLIKANGGKIYQTNTAASDTICIAERSMHLATA